jgi:ankyrin repeat protein
MHDDLRRRLRNAAGPPTTIGLEAIRERAAHHRRQRRTRLAAAAIATTVVLGFAAVSLTSALGSAPERVDASGGELPPPGEALLAAVRSDDAELAAELLAAGADPDNAGDFDATPLAIATARSNPELARLLIDAGADPSLPMSTGQAPIHIAASAGDTALVQLLVDARPDLVDLPVTGGAGSTPLMLAAGAPRPDTVAMLIALGADVNAANTNGFTSLHFAIEDGADPDVTRLLLDAGADPDLVAIPGTRTARESAQASPVAEIRDLLEPG